MHPILIVFLCLLYLAFNSYIMGSVIKESDGRFVRILTFLFAAPIVLITIIAFGICTIIFTDFNEERE